MFEILITACLIKDPAVCRDVLLPGHEAESKVECTQNLQSAVENFAKNHPETYHISAKSCSKSGKTLPFEGIAPGVFVHQGMISDAARDNRGDISNIGFVIGDNSIAVIDAAGSRLVAEEVYRAIRKHSALPISHVILTHMHPDHVLGASVFAEAGAKIVGSPNLRQALADRRQSYETAFGRLIGAADFIGSHIVMPDMVVDGEMTLDLGGRQLELRTWPQSHTNTDLTVLDRKADILFTGDLMFHRHAPALDGSLSGWQKVLDTMAGMKVTRIVPGHGGPVLPWPSSVKPMSQYLHVLETDTRSEIKKGTRLAEAVKVIAQSEAPNWQLFDLFNPRNATVAYSELEWE